MRVALVHDYLTQFGGGERVLWHLHRMYPDAPIYTLLLDPSVVQQRFPNADVRPSFLQSFPQILHNRHYLLPFSGAATEHIDLTEYDLVFSSSSSFAKGVITRPETIHIAYTHTPTRFLWDDAHAVLAERPRWQRIIARPLFQWLRLWDRQAAERPTVLVANSHHTRKRIRAYYNRSAVVVYPPVGWDDTDRAGGATKLSTSLPSTFHLVVAHLRKFKRIDVVIETFNTLQQPLVVVGEGPERRRLELLAGPTITFLGEQPDAMLQHLYQAAEAVVIPSREDFGIVAVEAQLAGTPVLAYAEGGSRETILHGVTGVLFEHRSPALLASIIQQTRGATADTFDSQTIRAHGSQFPPARFRAGMERVIERCLQKYSM